MLPVKLIKLRLIQCPFLLLGMHWITSWGRNATKGTPSLQEGTRKDRGTTTFRKPSTKGISECRMAWKARVSWIQAHHQARKFGMGYAMRMRTNMQGLMTASVSMSDWICMEGHNLHTGHFSQTLSSNEPHSMTHNQTPKIPQHSCSHGCCSSHSSAVPQPWISKTSTPLCSFSCSDLENNLVFFQTPVNSSTRWLPVQTWILQLCLLMEH